MTEAKVTTRGPPQVEADQFAITINHRLSHETHDHVLDLYQIPGDPQKGYTFDAYPTFPLERLQGGYAYKVMRPGSDRLWSIFHDGHAKMSNDQEVVDTLYKGYRPFYPNSSCPDEASITVAPLRLLHAVRFQDDYEGHEWWWFDESLFVYHNITRTPEFHALCTEFTTLTQGQNKIHT